MGSELALEVCLAVRKGELETAQQGFTSLLAQVQAEEALKLIGDCLLEAVRRQQRQLFIDWLHEAQGHLLAAAANPKAAATMLSFLQSMSFIICDRRMAEARPVLAQLIRRFTTACDAESGKALWAELLNLAARMARRGWREETSFLLRLYLRELLQTKNPDSWQERLLALQLHFVVYVRWDGFAKACSAYQELLLLYLLLMRRAGQKKYAEEQCRQYLLLSLRSLRGIITNAARSLMTDEMELFRQLYQIFWQLAGADKRRRQELQLLLQLAISYWQDSLPKTSRKQLKFLADLLQPDLIDEAYAALLKAI